MTSFHVPGTTRAGEAAKAFRDFKILKRAGVGNTRRLVISNKEAIGPLSGNPLNPHYALILCRSDISRMVFIWDCQVEDDAGSDSSGFMPEKGKPLNPFGHGQSGFQFRNGPAEFQG